MLSPMNRKAHERAIARGAAKVVRSSMLTGIRTCSGRESGRIQGAPARPSVRGVRCSGPRRLDLRALPWQERRDRLELLAQAFEVPLELSPRVEPEAALVQAMEDGRLEGIGLKDRQSTYRDGSRAGWTKVKDRSWYEREAWRFDRRSSRGASRPLNPTPCDWTVAVKGWHTGGRTVSIRPSCPLELGP
jgi:hypothetical protein